MKTEKQCVDNARDRETGAKWERNFGVMAGQLGKLFTPHQLPLNGKSASAYNLGPDGKKWNHTLLPDVTIWSAPGEHHELKHKNQTFDGCYGLECYRLQALVRFGNATGQKIYYTIHDWELAGGTSAHDDMPNRIEHWLVGDVELLSRQSTKPGWEYTWLNGVRSAEKVEMRYWTASRYFRPLAELWCVGAAA